ncbi:MAG: DUF1311 domain-containing protein [Haliscomenobacter sp.]|nr:DUF1311 domain-containing protein [Haliscomenobacter sp.]
MKTFLFGLLGLLFGICLKGQTPHPIDSVYSQCIENNPSTHGMVDCANTAAQAWDKELNTYYQLLIKALPAAQKEKLRLAQRAWLSFRDLDQSFSAGMYQSFDGTMWRIIEADVRTSRIRERALRLKSYYDDLNTK